MHKWLSEQYRDIKGNAKWGVLGAAWWAINQYGTKLLHSIKMPNWATTTIFLIFSVIAFIWLARRWSMPKQIVATAAPQLTSPSDPIPTVSSLLGKTPQITATPADMFRHSYFSPVTAEFEHNIKIIAQQAQDREAFYARLIGVGLTSYIHDQTWAYIFKSQLLMLAELNAASRGGLLPLAEAKNFYDDVVKSEKYPAVYPAYTFGEWLGFLEREQLLVHHPTHMLEITHRGKDLITYLAHWGRDINSKIC